jgi:hypothetical protein
LIVDHRSKRAKFSNQLNTQASVWLHVVIVIK